ncbi:hypothetical protein AAFF_G00018420 [Aldrovandia affinis]|uniref:Uncharacterized protein n=1 Tax=Aldrovandia affinis TaxID=143900 RepID=A0AAD7VXW2_9TELE|nr:hypothetical protein AAFF_G00018420 [Aldrovandia affinis]
MLARLPNLKQLSLKLGPVYGTLPEDYFSLPMTNHGVTSEATVLVGGVHRFPPEIEAVSRAWANGKQREAGFYLGVSPAVLRTRYNLTAADVGSAENNSQAVAQFLEQFYRPADLAEFMTLFGSGFKHMSKVTEGCHLGCLDEQVEGGGFLRRTVLGPRDWLGNTQLPRTVGSPPGLVTP